MATESDLKGQKTVLQTIADATASRIAAEKERLPLNQLKEQIEALPTAERRKFRDLFLTTNQQFPVIAEIKKASPSKGDIAKDLDPLVVAKDYIANGAEALSVLTEPQFFKGSIDYLRRIRQALPQTPILMKDFFIDSYQLYQAKAAGADAILVIVSLLGRDGSQQMMEMAQNLGLAALVEVHDMSELELAKDIGADLIGINSRNLKTLDISLNNILNLLPHVPADAVIIGESGIKQHDDLLALKSAGCHGFLIGTHLMATGQPGRALSELLKA